MNLDPQSASVRAPTLHQLNRATLMAAGAALIILTVAVLPAEYGRDPTGVGRLLGLTPMGEMKQGAKAEGAAPAPYVPPAGIVPPAAAPTAPDRVGHGQKEVTLTLAPDQGREVKAAMKAGNAFSYSWRTDGPEIRYELHGERFGAADGDFSSYQKGTSTAEAGEFKAPFDGTHGWFWRNRSGKPVTIIVTVSGTFETLTLMP